MRERKSDGPHSTDYETILCCGWVEGFEYTAKGPTIASIPSPPPCSMSALFGRRQAKAAPLAPRLRKGGEKHPPDQETPILPSDGGEGRVEFSLADQSEKRFRYSLLFSPSFYLFSLSLPYASRSPFVLRARKSMERLFSPSTDIYIYIYILFLFFFFLLLLPSLALGNTRDSGIDNIEKSAAFGGKRKAHKRKLYFLGGSFKNKSLIDMLQMTSSFFS